MHSWLSAVVAQGAIYAVPFAASTVLKVEPQGSTVQTRQLGSFGATMGKWSHAVLTKGNVYGVPWAATKILKVRAIDDEAGAVEIRTRVTRNPWFGPPTSFERMHNAS